MASPSMVQRSGDTLIVRSVVSGDRIFMEMTPSPAGSVPIATDVRPQTSPSSPVDGDQREDVDLPQCKIKRNYNCPHCNYFTQNPRHNLTHLRDVHDEKVKIYDCPNCLYASKHFQKLLRHMKMVHGSCDGVEMNGSLKRKLLDRTLRRDEAEAAECGEESPAAAREASRKTGEVASSGPPPRLSCSVCSFTAANQAHLSKHERKEHTKTKFFPCSKCNYVTHIKARFTKHVKYHSMPMIKCEVCDFRTPYKWNLDRHMKNHGGTGAFCCSVCNFTADIKQSLTVHEMNHHVPAVGQAGVTGAPPAPSRRRNKVGGSDAALLNAQYTLSATSRFLPHDQDASTCDSAQSDPTEPANIENKKNSTENDNPNVENFFYGKFTNDLMTNLFSKANSMENDSATLTSIRSNEILQNKEEGQAMKKTPRPIPNLIPLHLQMPVVTQPSNANNFSNGPLNLSKAINEGLSSHNSDVNMKPLQTLNYQNSTMEAASDLMCQDDSSDHPAYEHLSTRGSDESSQHSIQISSKNIFKRKNASFFDKLKEKLLTTTAESGDLTCKECGHRSKCLSEYSVHENVCTNVESKTSSTNFSSSGSTRCQHCRHRCKSSLDLVIHMQSCLKAEKDRESPSEHFETEKIEIPTQPESEEEASVDDPQVPHPMENVVFVWNSMLNNSNSLTFDNCLNSGNSEAAEVNDENLGSSKNIFVSTPNSYDVSAISLNSPAGKKVFKCPHCSFWASTASRFHVHIVGHLNKKPFECSFCSYRSNWRWDITKHIRLKSVRDPEHSKARVLMTDETGRRNYSKYNKYLTLMHTSEPSDTGKKHNDNYGTLSKSISDISDTSNMEKPALISAELSIQIPKETTITEVPLSVESISSNDGLKMADLTDNGSVDRKLKKSMWKCKKCSYRHASKEALLIHVRKHSRYGGNSLYTDQNADEHESADIIMPAADISGGVSYRCGHCNQVSNWKHVIQRHCRLKHNGDVRVIVGEKCSSEKVSSAIDNENNGNFDGKCTLCPFSTGQKNIYDVHMKQHSMTSLEPSLKCFLCPYFSKTEADLVQHLQIHDVLEPEQYIANILGIKSQTSEGMAFKRYKCNHCPYESNSKSQFMYHEQFHKPHDAPFKCDVCNYQVTKRHLLHQHMKVHLQRETETVGIPDKDNNCTESLIMKPYAIETDNMSDIPLAWVSFEGEFQKMYKCRYCPYVKLRKSNIQDHEKMHQFRDNLADLEQFTNIHQCPECSYACNNVDVFLSHSRVHEDDYAKVLCLVNLSKTDEQQISELKETINEFNLFNNNSRLISADTSNTSGSAHCNNADITNNREKQSEKFLYFCDLCPARFLCEKELLIHTKLHTSRLPYQCETCSYTARQQAHLMAHRNVHGEDYQQKTKALQSTHQTHPDHLQPKIVAVVKGPDATQLVWIVVTEGSQGCLSVNEIMQMDTSPDTLPSFKPISKQHLCRQCPAKFFKSSALHYHISLHGGDGKFKCKKCNYAVKTIGNLARHETVHDAVDSNFTPVDYESSDEINFNIPISGTDLFHHKTEVEKRALTEKLITRPNDHFPPVLQADPQFGLLMHGNPDFIYPTYLKNGRQKEKRYKCHKCPSAFEKREQYKVHLSLHGSKQRYKCEACDYSVKYYANYVQHMRKHQMNADAHVARQGPARKTSDEYDVTNNNSTEKLSTNSLTRQGYQTSSKLSISDQQTLKLLHRRRSSTTSKDNIEEKKIYRCTYCPYTNQRRDTVDNHMRRHNLLSGISGNYACPHCDFAARQSQFLREHLKIHFNTQKHIVPEFFANFDGLEITMSKIDDSDDISVDKACIFKMSDKLEILGDQNTDLGCKQFVVPSTGERVEG